MSGPLAWVLRPCPSVSVTVSAEFASSPLQNLCFLGGVRRCPCRVRCHLGLWPRRRGRVRRCPSPCPLNFRGALHKTITLRAVSVGVRAVSVAIWASGLGAAAVSVGVRRCPSPCPLNLGEALYKTTTFGTVSVGVRVVSVDVLASGLGAVLLSEIHHGVVSVGVRHGVRLFLLEASSQTPTYGVDPVLYL